VMTLAPMTGATVPETPRQQARVSLSIYAAT
jgi:hypothetical protein